MFRALLRSLGFKRKPRAAGRPAPESAPAFCESLESRTLLSAFVSTVANAPLTSQTPSTPAVEAPLATPAVMTANAAKTKTKTGAKATAKAEAKAAKAARKAARAAKRGETGQSGDTGQSGATGQTGSSSAEPGASNTGPTNSSILKSSGSIFVYANNTVIKNVAVDGTIYVFGTNCTIDNFTINAEGGRYGIEVEPGGSVTASDGIITNAEWAAVEGNNWTADKLNVFNLGADAFDGGGNNLLENCWIHEIGSAAGAHADGFQAVNGQNIVIKDNYFDIPWWSQVGNTVYHVNSCVFLNGSLYGAQYMNGTVITGNWLDGGNYSIYAMAQVNTKVTDNVFGPDSQWGNIYGTVAVNSGNTNSAT